MSFVIPARLLPWAAPRVGIELTSASGWWWHAVIEPWRAWLLLLGLFFILRAIPIERPGWQLETELETEPVEKAPISDLAST